MMRMKKLLKNSDTLTEFLNKNNAVAVIGVSTNPKKWGSKIYKILKSSNFNVYPINPKYKKIDNDVCYSGLKTLSKKPDVVITVVPPRVTEQIVKACKKIGISKVWMQPGSESEKAINFCKSNNIKIVYNTCFVADGLKKTVIGFNTQFVAKLKSSIDSIIGKVNSITEASSKSGEMIKRVFANVSKDFSKAVIMAEEKLGGISESVFGSFGNLRDS